MERFPFEFRPPMKDPNTGEVLAPAPSSLFGKPRHVRVTSTTSRSHGTSPHVGVDLPVSPGKPVYPGIVPSETTPVCILKNVVYDYGGLTCLVCYDLNGNGVIDFEPNSNPRQVDSADARMYARYMHLTKFGEETVRRRLPGRKRQELNYQAKPRRMPGLFRPRTQGSSEYYQRFRTQLVDLAIIQKTRNLSETMALARRKKERDGEYPSIKVDTDFSQNCLVWGKGSERQSTSAVNHLR